MTIEVETPVVVLGFHHGSLGIARSLGRLGVSVYGVSGSDSAPGLKSRYVTGRAVWPSFNTNQEQTVEQLLEYAGRLRGRPLLIPTSDDGALIVAGYADALAERFLFPRVPLETVRALCDKRELYHLAGRLGVPTPATVFPGSPDDVRDFAHYATFPVMLKGIDGLRLERRTGRKMIIAATAEELVRWYDTLEDPASPNLMIQEYIPGGDDTIWMFNGYFDGASECRAGYTGRKLRQHPVHTGATSLGICLHNQEVYDLTASFMRQIDYRGVLDIGYRFNARDGGYKLLDPNPRIGSTFRLFVDSQGMDVVRYLYLDLTGQSLPERGAYEGRKWLVEDQDIQSTLDYMREGTLTAGEWLSSFRGVQESAWFARDDMRPFFAAARAFLVKGLRSIMRRFARVQSEPPMASAPRQHQSSAAAAPGAATPAATVGLRS